MPTQRLYDVGKVADHRVQPHRGRAPGVYCVHGDLAHFSGINCGDFTACATASSRGAPKALTRVTLRMRDNWLITKKKCPHSGILKGHERKVWSFFFLSAPLSWWSRSTHFPSWRRFHTWHNGCLGKLAHSLLEMSWYISVRTIIANMLRTSISLYFSVHADHTCIFIFYTIKPIFLHQCVATSWAAVTKPVV